MEALSIKEIALAVKGKIIGGDENSLITFVSTNSKDIQKNTLFVPIIGERVDAHNFIEKAFEQGAIATLTSRSVKELENRKEQLNQENQYLKEEQSNQEENLNQVESLKIEKNFDKEIITKNSKEIYIEVEDTLVALQELASYYRSKFDIPIIGITGSVGKTTTKEMIAAALETKYKVLKTAGNMNSQVGLPLTMFNIEKQHQVAVIEMGMSEVGEMEKLAKIARPNIAVITNIGVSHIGQLKTQANILKEKLNIINEFEKDGSLYMNANDPLLDNVFSFKIQNQTDIDLNIKTREKLEHTSVVSFGTTNFCDYKASNVQTIDGETHFTFENGIETMEIVLSVLGIHNVYNALVALAIAKQLKIEPAISKRGLYQYQPIAMRGQIHEINDMKLIDDTYNASPDSIKGAIAVLLELDNTGKKIAVLADILELGEISYQCHYDIGIFISTTAIDEVVTVGNEASAIAKAIKDTESGIRTTSFANNENAIAYLKTKIKAKDAILVKGSRGMHTDEIIEALKITKE